MSSTDPLLATDADVLGIVQAADASGLSSLPEDALQPWEVLDPGGHAVVATAEKGAVMVDEDSVFNTGGDVHTSAGDVALAGSLARMQSGSPGDSEVTYAIHRLLMAGQDPGVVTVDANLLPRADGSSSSYYVGLSNYGSGSWEWYGPVTDASVRIQPDPTADYLSGLGNLFVAVTAWDGSCFDLVGIGANPVDPADTTAPVKPAGLQLHAVTGGVELRWLAVPTADLAGYRVYYSDVSFTNPHVDGVNMWPYLEGQVSCIIPVAATAYFRVTAIDFSGNESTASDLFSAAPLTGDPPAVRVLTSAAEGQSGAVISLTATAPGIPGAVFDIDTDGDGIYDLAGIAPGTANIDTGATGVVRPRVRARSTDGSMVALGSVSAIISSNIRPVADGYASPAYGDAPHTVTFTGQGFDDDGLIVEYAWDFNGDGTYDWSDAATPNPPAQVYNTAGTYNTKFRVTDDAGSIDIDTVTVTVYEPEDPPVNIPPTAELAADKTRLYISAFTGLTATFDASASADPEGGALAYEFDPEGDGTYVDNGGTATFQYEYTLPGVYLAGLRVTDAAGATARDTVQVSVYRFDCNHIEADYPTGDYISATIVDGNPVVAYYLDGPDDDLYYCRANDASGRTWLEPQLVESANNSGKFCSIAEQGNFPAIAYFDTTSGELTFCKAADIYGDSWNPPVTVDTGMIGTCYCSLLDVDGRAGIFYHHDADDKLYFVRATTASGSSWGTPVVVSTTGGEYNSAVIVDGNPAVAFERGGNLYYSRAEDTLGATWSIPTVLDSSAQCGFHASLAVVDGYPAVAYYSYLHGDLRYIRASDATGSAWGGYQDILTDMDYGQHCSLAVINGIPAISCYEDPSNLIFITALDATGSTWEESLVVDYTSAGYYTNLLELETGLPGIAYQYYYGEDAMFADVSLE